MKMHKLLATFSAATAATFALANIVPAQAASVVVRHATPAKLNIKTTAGTVNLYGGGATLPAYAYVFTNAFNNGPVNPANPTGASSAFGFFDTKNSALISYCQTGSGYGKKVAGGVAASATADANLPCAAIGVAPVAGTNGFGGANVQEDFNASDAPYTQSEYTSFVTNGTTTSTNVIKGSIAPVQVPVAAGAVAMLWNNSDSSIKTPLYLTDTAICKITAGLITNWGNVSGGLYKELIAEGIASSKLSTTGLAWKTKSLYFVSRNDGSGTTFSFMNHLTGPSVCPANLGLAANQTFTSAIPAAATPDTGASYTNFRQAAGNAGVTACIKNGGALGTGSGTCTAYGSTTTGSAISSSGDGAIGYAEEANSNASGFPANRVAQVNGIQYTALTTAANNIDSTTLLTNVQVNQPASAGSNGANAAASTTALTGIPSGVGNCMVVVDPTKYSKPASGYPIVAVTYLDFKYASNPTGKAPLLRKLATQFYTSTNFSSTNISTIDLNSAASGSTGYSTLNITGTNKLGSSSIITTATGSSCITGT